MIGAVILAVVIVIVIPVAVSLGSVLIAAALGWSLKSDVEAEHEGSELIELNK